MKKNIRNFQEIAEEIKNMSLEEVPGTMYTLQGRIYLGQERSPTSLNSSEDYQTTRFYLLVEGIEGEGVEYLTWYLRVIAETPYGICNIDEQETDHVCEYVHVTGGYKLEGDVPSDFADEIVEYLRNIHIFYPDNEVEEVEILEEILE